VAGGALSLAALPVAVWQCPAWRGFTKAWPVTEALQAYECVCAKCVLLFVCVCVCGAHFLSSKCMYVVRVRCVCVCVWHPDKPTEEFEFLDCD